MKPLKRFFARPLSLVVLLAVFAAAAGVLFVHERYVYVLLCVASIVVIAMRLLRLYGESMRRVNFLLDAIRNNDLNFRFSEKMADGDERPLNIALNRIREIVVAAKLQAEERERYYQLIMECAHTGLLTVDDAGSVYQVNGEALRIFGLQRMTHIRQVQRAYPEACSVLAAIQPEERRHVKCSTESGEVNLSLSCSEIQLEQRPLRVISVSDIDDYLSAAQIESWSKLTRILTHEIMNSLAPITSLSDMLLHLNRPLDADVVQGLDTISATSRRLTAFVETFRRFTRIPEPRKSACEVRPLLERAVKLMDSQIRIRLDVSPADMLIYADEGLIEQVVMNLLKNAAEAAATCHDPQIGIVARIDAAECVQIDVTDNAKAIAADVAENIFTPFFTTKCDGSGIGLSVSRRIMQLHDGSLRLTSNVDGRVTFTMRFE